MDPGDEPVDEAMVVFADERPDALSDMRRRGFRRFRSYLLEPGSRFLVVEGRA